MDAKLLHFPWHELSNITNEPPLFALWIIFMNDLHFFKKYFLIHLLKYILFKNCHLPKVLRSKVITPICFMSQVVALLFWLHTTFVTRSPPFYSNKHIIYFNIIFSDDLIPFPGGSLLFEFWCKNYTNNGDVAFVDSESVFLCVCVRNFFFITRYVCMVNCYKMWCNIFSHYLI